jgi:hypothetical protein
MASITKFKEIQSALKNGNDLTLEMVGYVFGNDFWVLLVQTMMDSNDAARAIQGAINRLSTKPEVNKDYERDIYGVEPEEVQ